MSEAADLFKQRPLPEPWRTTAVLIALLLLFWGIYLHIGMAMEERGTLRNNMFFHSDIGRVIGDIARPHAPHERTSVHPLFVLLTHPFGAGLAYLTKSPPVAAVTLNSLVGGLSVALACLFFRITGVSLRRSALGALFLGLTASNLYFGSAPETYIFSLVSIIVLFIGAARRPGAWSYFLPAGILSFGVLITNGALAVITYGVSLARPVGWVRRLSLAALLGVSILAVSTVLALVQKQIWPGSDLFFRPAALKREEGFESDRRTWQLVGQREALLLRYVLVFDFIAPKTYINKEKPTRPALQISTKSLTALPAWGRVAAVIWGGLMLCAVWLTAKNKLYRQPVILGLLLCILDNLILHTLYGDDLFLYSCNTCFTMAAWVLLSLCAVKQPRLTILIDSLLLVLVVAEAMNNVSFVKAIVAMRHVSS
ncbi:MAG TPA: hypothetical protein VGO11_04535 [Chthoniobacteraceae bacterium]|jgi:hypothetical protein|nr:hypothetical protein [Chthoniobacteraceae bacterium]